MTKTDRLITDCISV